MRYKVTTSLKMNEELVKKAKRLACQLGIPYIERKKCSLASLLEDVDALLVVYHERLILEQKMFCLSFFILIRRCYD